MNFADLLKEPGAEVVHAPSSPQPALRFADLLAAPGAEVIEPPGKLEALGRGALQGATLGHGVHDRDPQRLARQGTYYHERDTNEVER